MRELVNFAAQNLPSQNLWCIDFVGKNENLKTLVQQGVTINNRASFKT